MQLLGFPLNFTRDQWVTRFPNGEAGRLPLESEPAQDGWGRQSVPRTSGGVFRKTPQRWEHRARYSFHEILYRPPAGSDTNIDATRATAAFSTAVATVRLNVAISATRPTATFVGRLATVQRDTAISATRPVATLATYTATVSQTSDTNIAATRATATLVTYVAGITGSVQPSQAGQTPAGGSQRKRRRWAVEIDGQTFVVGSEAEAESLLARAADIAAEAAQEAAQAVVSRELPRVRALGRVPQINLRPRVATSAPPTPHMRSLRDAINRVYEEAAQRAELQLLMERQAALDDEQEIEEMLAMGDL